MADSDKNIVITPFRGATSQPNIVFTGQGNDPITVRVLDGTTGTGLTAGGALSFEGSAGQLFSVVNRLGTGSIFSVNDISGIPSLDVDANGTVEIAPFTGYVAIGLTAPTEKLHVVGNILSSGSVNAFGGVSASGGTFGENIAVNGGNVTTTSTTASLFNTNSTTINIANSQTAGVTLNIASATIFSGEKNINIGRNNGGGAVTNVVIGGNSNDKISLIGGVTIGSPALTNTNIVGNLLTVTPQSNFLNGVCVAGNLLGVTGSFSGLVSLTSGLSASGGITFNSPIISTRLPRYPSSIFETKTANFNPAEADNGKIFIVTVSGKSTLTITFDGLSVGWRAKFLCTDTGQVTFTSSLGTVVGTYGSSTADNTALLIEVICYAANSYYAG